MATDTSKPVGPGTFRRPPHPYQITIENDGKVWVKKDDWLSKYAWALYGDYEAYDVFYRPDPKIESPYDRIRGIKVIDFPDEIDEGECLIHEPTYFAWKEKLGERVEPKPRRKVPLKPGQVRSTSWMAASLGGWDPSIEIGMAGVLLLAFKNLDVGKNFYFAYVRAGVGLGLDPASGLGRAIRVALKAAGAGLFLSKAPFADFVPVTTFRDFSARTLEDLSVESWGWKVSSGPHNYEFERVKGRTSVEPYFDVTFKGTSFYDIPGADAHYAGGAMFWIW